MPDWILTAKMLLLLWIANGAPIIATRLMGRRLATPIDFHYHLPDGQPLFGKSKTWRGILSACLLTSLLAVGLDFSPWSGLFIALLAMAGDLLSSFIKRRLGMAASERALLLDQIPEALFPLLVLVIQNMLNWLEALIVMTLFVFTDIVLSRLLFRLKIRRRPY